MTGYTCPAEGCDYGETEEKTKGSVKAHINAKSDDPHSDRAALREAVERQEPGATDDADESSTDEAVQAAGDQANSDESDPAEATESDPEAMATEDEYQQQRETTDESTDDSDDDDADSGGSGGGEAAAAAAGGAGLLGSLGVNPLVLVGVAVLALLLWSLYAGDGGGSDPATQSEPEPAASTAEPASEAASAGGGLIEEGR